jgi:hypothetical protein
MAGPHREPAVVALGLEFLPLTHHIGELPRRKTRGLDGEDRGPFAKRRRLLPLVLGRFSKAHAWPTAVLVDELDAGAAQYLQESSDKVSFHLTVFEPSARGVRVLINSRRVQRAWFGLTWAKGACYEFWTKAGMDLARGFA